jgi:hypothetical protein
MALKSGPLDDFRCTLCYSTLGRALIGLAQRSVCCAEDRYFEKGGKPAAIALSLEPAELIEETHD